MGVSMSLEQAGDASGAADAYRQSIELLETAHEVSGMPEELAAKAEALTLLAHVLHRSLDGPKEALGAYEAAAESYRELDDARHLRKVSLSIAGLRWRAGNPERSAQAYEDILESAPDEPAHRAAALASLGVIYRDPGRLKESLTCGREALRSLRDLHDPRAESYVLSSLAESHTRLGQHPSARSCLRHSLRLRQEPGDEEGEINALRSLAKIYRPGRPESCPILTRRGRT
jgi:tetratricopeptide (TPR) repeat protein